VLVSREFTVSKRQRKFLVKNLKELGLASYHDYLKSDLWREVKARYRRSKLPQTCHFCHDPNVDLHHRTYWRVGTESLNDLVPLCREHHDEAHTVDQAGRRANRSDINLWTASREVRNRHQAPGGGRSPARPMGRVAHR
jgi:hypothetical protein